MFLLFIDLTFSKPAQAKFIADGLTVTPLTDDGRSTAAGYSYHGDWTAFLREESSTQKQLMIMKSDGSNARAVTPLGNTFFIEWSWDDTKISYEFSSAADSQSQAQVYIYDLNTKKAMSVSAPYTRYALDEDDGPFFSLDGKYVAYNVRVGPAVSSGSSRTYQLWIANVQSGKYWQILPGRSRTVE